jgi:hypothetical protein
VDGVGEKSKEMGDGVAIAAGGDWFERNVILAASASARLLPSLWERARGEGEKARGRVGEGVNTGADAAARLARAAPRVGEDETTAEEDVTGG